MSHTQGWLHPRSLTASLPLKNGGWKTSFLASYWEGIFLRGKLLNFGRVSARNARHLVDFAHFLDPPIYQQKLKNCTSQYHISQNCLTLKQTYHRLDRNSHVETAHIGSWWFSFVRPKKNCHPKIPTANSLFSRVPCVKLRGYIWLVRTTPPLLRPFARHLVGKMAGHLCWFANHDSHSSDI